MSILVFCLIEDLTLGCGGPRGRSRNCGYRGGVGDCGRECNPFIVRGTGIGSSRGSGFFLVGTLGGPVARGATVQAKVVFPTEFLLNGGNRAPLLTYILTGTGGKIHWSTVGAGACARSRGGVLSSLCAGRIAQFGFSPYLVVNFDTELYKCIKIIRGSALIRQGLSEFAVESPSKVRDFGPAIIA